MKEDIIFQIVTNEDNQSGKFITGDKEFNMIKEENSDSWQIILENEMKKLI